MRQLLSCAPEFRTFVRHFADFDLHPVFQSGMSFCDLDSFLQIVNSQQKVTADGFLGFSERPIDNCSPSIRAFGT